MTMDQDRPGAEDRRSRDAIPSDGKATPAKGPGPSAIQNGLDIRNNAQCSLLFENTGTAMLIVEVDGTVSMVNGKTLEQYGCAISDIVTPSKQFSDFLTPPYREMAIVYHELLKAGQFDRPTPFECQIVDQAGEIREVLAHIGWIAETRQAVISLMDETAARKAERQRRYLNAVVSQSLEGILLTDSHGTIVYVNAAFETLSGYGRDEIVGRTFEHPFFNEQDRLIFKKMSFSVSGTDAGEHRSPNPRKDGATVATITRIAPVCNDKGRVTHLACQKKDIQRETELEQQLFHSQKMEAIGTLASGIAHDFNNIISGITGFAEMARRVAPGHDQIKRYMENILQACERAGALTHQVLGFSRQKQQGLQPVSLPVLVSEVLTLIEASLPKTIELRTCLVSEAPAVLGDPVRIHQIVMNLCTNAAQAMAAGGGVLEVSLDITGPPPEAPPPAEGAPACAYVCLTVGDTGEGIDPQTLRHIFEPYFTTKAGKGGTGLGLSLVRKSVQEIGGCIQVTSEPGRGSTFKIHLPCMAMPQADTCPE
ncbi:MAG: PAS domain S-box protein [Desulfatitalea sp.]|nr:PAS domain S-box protein [Desulfatitalea sp.]